ncbi:MAG: polyprenyl synthetase family protein [Thermodesulfovibrionales bacterium]|nr:polyprenyl synthetase family protein [Thermodesulfovibrionales bacterium]
MLNHQRTVDIKQVFEAYAAELGTVEEKLKGLFRSDVFVIPLVGSHLLDSGGKRLRPLFLLASARLAGYRGDDHTMLAGVIELIHMASLLHDDVVDGAQLRRGKPAAHSIWGNQVVILVGDFLYSNALKKSVSFKNQRIMEALSEATTSMSEGELLQLSQSGDIGIAEEDYLKIISSKTGMLISAACRIGAILAGRPIEEEEALARFGMKSGTAFQMADDIMDYMADEGEFGKRLGKDLEEGKVTLPLICLLGAASSDEKEEVRGIIEKGISDGGLRRILALFKRYNVLEESVKRATVLVEEAKFELLIFPDSVERDGMFDLADYALLRQN